MFGEVPAKRLKLIERIVQAARLRARRRPPRARWEPFLRAYYRGVDEEDLAARDPGVLAAVALEHFALGHTRPPGVPLVHVFTPSPAQDGYSCPNTLVLSVSADMPFLVDSLGIVFSKARIGVHLIVHPVLSVERDARGKLTRCALGAPADPSRESWQMLEIDRQLEPGNLTELRRELLTTLSDVHAAVQDWRAMRRKALSLAAQIEGRIAGVRHAEVREASSLLKWMAEDHFTFLGYREYRLKRGKSSDLLTPLAESGLGILHSPRRGVPPPASLRLRGELRQRARERVPLIVTKANSVSTVHRATYLDYVGVKIFDRSGTVTGEHRFLGLWTSSAYHLNPRDIPVLGHKVREVAQSFGVAPGSHDAKAVQHVLETYPRDELFQASIAELVHTVRGVVNLYERDLVRVFVRRDAFERFYSCLIYVPRDRYNTAVRFRIETILREALGGRDVETQVQLSESTLARLHSVVRSEGPARRRVDIAALEQAIDAAATTWEDRLGELLAARISEPAALATARHFAQGFPAAYTEDVEPAEAIADIAHLQALDADPQSLRLAVHRPPGQIASRVHLKIVKFGEPVPISDALPMMENFGLRVIAERPYELTWPRAPTAWIQDFELEHREGTRIDIQRIDARLREAFLAVWRGQVENDGFNRLLLAADLSAREIVVLRAYCRYLLQTGVAFSQAYMERVLSANASIARTLYRLFALQLDPAAPRRPRTRTERLAASIRTSLDAVRSLDEDRILRAYLTVIEATLRTNYFQPDASGLPKPYVSLKLDPQRIPDLPLPRPKFEIFLYSPRVEAVHLRMASVARGGIRWSDRREDFRTEVLGLMKAQNVKNTVIVPMGAKGGFVVKRPPATGGEALQREVIACYQTFMRGLLDVTDNIVAGRIVPPAHVLRRDSDDPYLVVAADKGTASFSDIANGISAEYGFWLGDAFASGGSAGYDHKKMGITARGAWECVKRHFRELGVDIQRSDFTASGIGDMSGDVFGNGMLLSRHTRLLAAFNHQHIFLDPSPDARRSFAERARLAALPRSSWEDYDRRLISRGGGIYTRSAKSIALSREIQTLLGLSAASATPQDVIRAILKMPVDLLWNGGIGTYVKATTESHLEIGDRTNDGVRVNGAEVAAKVVGEGGNLGFSQRGRVEYAQRGGRLNTDFIDNSAGVNTSDVEVNIKILLNPVVQAGKLRLTSRDKLLASMTDDVAQLVLRNNYLQSQALSTLELQSAARLAELQHVIRLLERSGDLNRAIEFLPTDDDITDRRKRGMGLTRPELAVVLSYSKIWLSHHLLASDVPEDPFLARELVRYFPAAVGTRFARAIARHRLRREIIVTSTANSLINRMGPGFVLRAQEDTGADPARIARAYTAAREIFGMRTLWNQIEALDNRVAAKLQYAMMYETGRLLRHVTYWLLHGRSEELKIAQAVAELGGGVRQLADGIEEALTGLWREHFEAAQRQYDAAGVPGALAARVAGLDALNAALDIVGLAREQRIPVPQAARAYFLLGERIGLDWLQYQVERLAVEGSWQAIARTELRYAVFRSHRAILAHVLATASGRTLEQRIDAWVAAGGKALEHWLHMLAEMRAAGTADFATLSVGLESVRKLA
ncbi:MAG TPA: NAD-glutamate dehydrogenase [Steroidobacteraceae bacterium]|nr:NAD-glutamate dehydrogenase [Steroidobacteraceae bacterium]